MKPRPRLLEGARPAGRHRAPLQHGRTAADRAVRHGRPFLRPAGARREPSPSTETGSSAAASVTSRTSSGRWPTWTAKRRGEGRQHREHRRDHDSRSRRAGATGVRIRVRDSFDSLRRGIRDWFRGHATPIPDISKIGDLLDWRATRTLDQILQDVIESQRAPAALTQSA